MSWFKRKEREIKRIVDLKRIVESNGNQNQNKSLHNEKKKKR